MEPADAKVFVVSVRELFSFHFIVCADNEKQQFTQNMKKLDFNPRLFTQIQTQHVYLLTTKLECVEFQLRM